MRFAFMSNCHAVDASVIHVVAKRRSGGFPAVQQTGNFATQSGGLNVKYAGRSPLTRSFAFE